MLKNEQNNKIGIFDSGLGGLSVLKHLLNDLPEYEYIYLGDNARLPYGDKSEEKIYEYSREAIEFLFKKGCNLIIIACNTASAQALPRLQKELINEKNDKRRILGVIRPLAEHVSSCHFKKVGVIGTKSTINSHAYQLEIKKINPKIEVIEKATPLLVPLIENSWSKKPETKMILKKYLKSLKDKEIQSLVLACTHYPLLLKDIRRICGKNIDVPDPGKIVSLSLSDYIDRHSELKLNKNKENKVTFFATDEQELFKDLGSKFLGKKIKEIKKAKL
ncbi:MAG: glutamate racemase [Patescibacteria group bacterium]|jgi:glutamate racemase|nr:glutamate racemase [Patescibacteria group bacterium]